MRCPSRSKARSCSAQAGRKSRPPTQTQPAVTRESPRNCQRRPSKTATAFEPFFTTREVGKGTGLGLSQVYGLARQSGGTVRIQRETSAGTEVEIYVPRALGATNPEPPQAEEDMLKATVRRRGTEWVTDLVRCATCRRFAGGALVQGVGVSEETESSPSHWGWKRSWSNSLESAPDEFISTSAGVVGRGGVPC